jgi:hypothetical protein
MIHMLGDLDSTMGDHRVGAAGVTSHGEGEVDQRPDVGGLQREVGCHRWYTRGGWVKHEVEAARSTDGDTIVACGTSWGVEVACGASWGTVAAQGAGVDFGVARGTGWDAGVARSVPIISEVPTIEEGYVGTLNTRYPRVQVLGQDKRRGMQITRSRVSTTSA